MKIPNTFVLCVDLTLNIFSSVNLKSVFRMVSHTSCLRQCTSSYAHQNSKVSPFWSASSRWDVHCPHLAKYASLGEYLFWKILTPSWDNRVWSLDGKLVAILFGLKKIKLVITDSKPSDGRPCVLEKRHFLEITTFFWSLCNGFVNSYRRVKYHKLACKSKPNATSAPLESSVPPRFSGHFFRNI